MQLLILQYCKEHHKALRSQSDVSGSSNQNKVDTLFSQSSSRQFTTFSRAFNPAAANSTLEFVYYAVVLTTYRIEFVPSQAANIASLRQIT